MCANKLSKVALDSAAAGIEVPAISNRKSNALTTAPPSQHKSVPSIVEAPILTVFSSCYKVGKRGQGTIRFQFQDIM